MSINKTQLLTQLQTLLNTSYQFGSTCVDDVVSSSLSLNVLSETNIITVATTNSLPNLSYYNSPSGMVYYVVDLAIFALSSGKKWLTLDGRLLRQDTVFGELQAWGSNSDGRLGDNTVTNRSSPVSVVGGFSDWCQMSAGMCHNLAVRANGTLWVWGRNTVGELGDNTNIDRSSPVSVVGGFTDWCQTSAREANSLAVRTNGTLWAWGCNQYGRLGDNSTINRSSPVSVVGGFTDWCQASTSFHSLAVRTNGTLWAWGNNSNGQLGDDTNIGKSSPVSVVGGFTDWCQASAGRFHSIGLRTNGSVWTWGSNNCGQLGDATLVSKSSPVSVVGGFTDWCQISAGDRHSVAVRTNGSAWGWGYNSLGQLGDNTNVTKSSPVSVVGGFADWCQVSAGGIHSVGLRTNGTFWAWGRNTLGQLGDNTAVTKSSPVSVVGGFADWCQSSAGQYHTLGLRAKC